ncbi:MAG: DUF4382 domain-containing protein [Nitrososphaeria archaeon]|nr:DUF4382 domain-containing protein [Nitrososphaeria archaeon]
MSSKKNVIISGFIALVAALLIIVASMFAGIAPHQIQPTSTQSSSTIITSSTMQTTSITSSITQPTLSSTTTQISTTTSTHIGKGILAILFTDPPKLAEGVTAVYINYSKIGVHYSKPNVGQGWVWTRSEGTNLNLTALDGVAQAIESIEIETGASINLIRFNITGAKVEYNDRNYTAFVRTGNLTIVIIGGLQVNDGVNALLVDIEPTVFNMGTKDEPLFVLTAVAKGYPVPQEGLEEIRDKIHMPGFKFVLKNRMWWQRLRQMHASSIEITSAEVSSKLLKVNVKNTGGSDVMLRLVIVFPVYARTDAKKYLPSYFEGAAVFLIKSDRTLEPLKLRYKQNMGEDVKSMLMISRGYKLEQGKSVELKYEDELIFEYGLRLRSTTTPTVSEYLVTVIGDGVADTYTVKV